MAEHAIVEGLLYRLIKKHIAGTTMSSAIDKAKELNEKKLPVSITFLSDGAMNSTKARYATTTYLELIRRIARMGLKASVQVPLSQVGSSVSNEVAIRNVREILDTANKHGVFVWLEPFGLSSSLPVLLQDARGVGYAVNVKDSSEYLRKNREYINALKILFTERAGDIKGSASDMTNRIRFAVRNTRGVVLQSVPDNIMRGFLNGSRYRKSLVFEFQLGHSKKAISSIMKRGARTSMYVPFGKDWTQYAINKVPETYARFLASKLLREGAERV